MGLQMLLSAYVCSDYDLEHDIKYNSTKINVMISCCKKFKDIHMPNFVLDDEILTRVNKCKYLVLTEDLSDDDNICYTQLVWENLCSG